MKKIVLLAFVLVLLLPIIVVTFFSAPVKAEPKTIYVDVKNTGSEDGSKEHPYNTIIEGVNAANPGDTVFVYNGTYQESNIALDKDNLSLIGESRDVTIIDGVSSSWILIITAQNVTVTGFTIQYSPVGTAGIFLDHAIQSKISDNIIKNHDSGIYSVYSNSNVIENNLVADNNLGIALSWFCKENKIRGNTVTSNAFYTGINLARGAHENDVENNNIFQNTYGILISSNNNSIFSNQIIDNDVGISEYLGPQHVYLGPTSGNRIFHNNFINNTKQTDLGNQSTNIWDNGQEGNYWNDYKGTDLCSGIYQNETGSDGIGDTAYIMNENNTDHCPLMGNFSEFPVIWQEETFHVNTICNSTISAFQFDQTNKLIKFNVTDRESIGFCRVAIPNILVQEMWQGNYTVLVDAGPPLTIRNWTGETYTYAYFTYQHPEHEVEIIPEFPSFLILSLFIIAALVALIVYKRKHTVQRDTALSCFLANSAYFSARAIRFSETWLRSLL